MTVFFQMPLFPAKVLCRHKCVLGLAVLSLVGACVSRAPTKCELDKRAGLYPSSFCEGVQAALEAPPAIRQGDALGDDASDIPVRSVPLVKKVWMHDQILQGGHWMKGSWLYIEVEPSQWVGTSSAVSAAKPSARSRVQAPQPLTKQDVDEGPRSSGFGGKL